MREILLNGRWTHWHSIDVCYHFWFQSASLHCMAHSAQQSNTMELTGDQLPAVGPWGACNVKQLSLCASGSVGKVALSPCLQVQKSTFHGCTILCVRTLLSL
eukprot:GHRR01034115.1.p3 GENE.GHRR01034115.1~~GHRR01034115.1.p3  ORF type:complete len:102 (-),score=6.34 GHRR01034115.1:1083-1388(-)